MSARPLANVVKSSALSMRSVMSETRESLRTDETLAEAHSKMTTAKHLPVMHEGKLVGVLSRRDLHFLRRVAAADTTIGDIAETIVPDVYTVSPDDSAAAVVTMMAQQRYGSVVVVDRGQVIGLFTAYEALGLLAELLS